MKSNTPLLSLLLAVTVFSPLLSASETRVAFLNPAKTENALPFSEAVKVGDMLILSGQVGINPQTGKLAEGGFAAQTHQTLLNIKQVLNRYKHKMSDVVKCTVILTDINKFPEFNQIYKQHFSYPYPTRTTFAVSDLAVGAEIEIECMAAK